MFTALRRPGLLLLGLALVTSCSSSERAAAPLSETSATQMTTSNTPASGDLLGSVVGTLGSTLRLTTATGLLRTKPLAAPITVVQTIGRDGGTLSIPAAGVTVVVPQGALQASTQITMTARAGSLVAYDFAPHGITFEKPLVFSQNLKGTNATLLMVPFLRLAYYSDPSLLGQTTALVSELVGGVFNVLNWTFTAPIRHFSGYLVACGRGEE